MESLTHGESQKREETDRGWKIEDELAKNSLVRVRARKT